MTFAKHLFKTVVAVCLLATSGFFAGLTWPFIALAQDEPDVAPLVIGRKDSLEQELVALMSELVLHRAGIPVQLGKPTQTANIRRALRQGDVGLYWEYTGTALFVFNRQRERLPIDQQLIALRKLDAGKGLTWLTPSRIDNSFVTLMLGGRADGYGIANLSDLATLIRDGWQLRLGMHTEFYARPDGMKPLQTAYEFKLPDALAQKEDASVDLLPLLIDGTVDAIIADRNIVKPDGVDLRFIDDDLSYFPSYILTPVVRVDVLERWPAIENHLSTLALSLDNGAMAELLAEVSEPSTDLADLAERFLIQRQLIEPLADN